MLLAKEASISIHGPKSTSYLLVVVSDRRLGAVGATAARAGGFVAVAAAEAAGPSRLARASDRIPELECGTQDFFSLAI